MNLSKYEKSLIFIFFIVAIYASFFFYQDFKIKEEIRIKEEKEFVRIEKIKKDINVLDIEAKAVSVYDITDNKKLYGRNDIIPMSLASLAKIMTILVALEDKNDSPVIISKNALSEVGDNSLFLGEKWNKEDLIKFTLIMSSNDGAYALAENDSTFINRMNSKAERLGLYNMAYQNVSGLDIDKQLYGAVGTAEEMNMLIEFALLGHREIFQNTKEEEMDFTSLSLLEHKAINTNIIINKIPNLVFSKTGATDLTGGNLSIVFKNKEGHEIAITILGSSIEGRFSDMEKIVNVLYNIENAS